MSTQSCSDIWVVAYNMVKYVATKSDRQKKRLRRSLDEKVGTSLWSAFNFALNTVSLFKVIVKKATKKTASWKNANVIMISVKF